MNTISIRNLKKRFAYLLTFTSPKASKRSIFVRCVKTSTVVMMAITMTSVNAATEQNDILSSVLDYSLAPNPLSFGLEYESQEQLQDIDPEPIPYSVQPKKNDSFLPLFTQTCDNISYSGVVENQAIAILEDTRDFIEQVTDPVVNVTKFEAGIFLYSLGKCLPEVTKDRFSADCKKTVGDGDNSKSVNTGESCFVDKFIDAVSGTDKLISATTGAQGALNGTVGKTLNTKASTEKTPVVMAKTIEGIIDDGWFDRVAGCVYDEKKKILSKLNSLFDRNYRVKTSVIQSVNNMCSVSLREKGDPSTWGEIFDMQAELMGEDSFDFMKGVKEVPTKKSLADQLKEAGYGTCVDGFSISGGCMTKEQEEKLKILSAKVEYDNDNYRPSKAYSITRHFFDKGGVLKNEYKSSPTFINIITKAVPSSCNAGACTPVSIDSDSAPSTKFEQDYRKLRDVFNIDPTSNLSAYLDDIFYGVFPKKAHIKLLTGDDLKSVVLPTQNPFDPDLFRESKTTEDRFVIMKTLTNRSLIVLDKYSSIERKRITDFYRSIVEALFINDNMKDEIAPYKTSFVVSEHDFEVFSAAITKLANDNSQMGRVIGSNNALTEFAARERAGKELAAIQTLSWMEILKTVFNTDVQPSIYYQVSNSIDYELVSKVKDYTIPLNFNHNKDFLKVRRFFQTLSIKYSEHDIDNSITVRGADIEDMVSSGKTEKGLLQLAKTPSADEVLDYINRIQKKSNVLNARLINFPE